MKILVRNLSRSTTESEINTLFSGFGEITACDLVLDKETGASKGFGFVEMTNDKEAQAAIAKLHMSELAGSKIRVKVAE